ncbi:hypothetical protein [Bacteroides neonati]|uniref:hypothetical protein n=1 Tax=Bacteroides neonati TaxID=1347393 RepID=UPI0006932153|nr:hypothetical protein [Bacteroides neonati]
MNGLRQYAIRRGRESPLLNRGMSFQITTIGAAQVESAVSELLDIDKDKAIRAGLRSMGNTLVSGGKRRLKSRLKDSSGLQGKLFKAFKIRVKLRKPGALVGFNKDGHHSHLVDMGTEKRKHPITGTSGIMPANSFWTDTAREDWDNASKKLFEGIERAKNRIIERNSY